MNTVLDYPFIVNIFAYDSIEMGISKVCSYFPALTELLNRSDAVSSLATLLNNHIKQSDSDSSLSFKEITALTILKYCNEDIITSGTTEILSNIGTVSQYTPNGTPVTLIIDLDWADHDTNELAQQSIKLQYLATYPSAVEINDVNPSYNCHAYSFLTYHDRYWLNDPSPYILDGSYIQCSQPNGDYGVRVIYESSYGGLYIHSAITAQTGPVITVTSKWGVNALFRHAVNDCPYAISSAILYYERA